MMLERGSTGRGAATVPVLPVAHRLSSSPAHSSGRVRPSGSSWWSRSMKVRATRNQVTIRAPRAGKPNPNFQATAADSTPVRASTSG
jgi:hypothetical protein